MLFKHSARKVLFTLCCLALIGGAIGSIPQTNSAAEFSGREILSVSRIAHGGPDYANLQYVTVKASGFVNAVAFGGLAANPLGGMAEVKLNITDYQDKQLRRRLEVAPTATLPGRTYLVFTGSTGGGMIFGNEFRMREASVSRHWGMMGFDTLNRSEERRVGRECSD